LQNPDYAQNPLCSSKREIACLQKLQGNTIGMMQGKTAQASGGMLL